MIRISSSEKNRLRRALLKWFAANARKMPWRNTRDPYRIWVSEVLLQQTRVAAVLPYYRNFLKHFPTLERLAAAPMADILRAWSGLGYYARARNLRAAAREIVARHGGTIPDSREELLRLPGIGPYTASALLSFLYGKPEAVVDGNVIRVLSRLFAVRGDPRAGPIRKEIDRLAGELVPQTGSRQFNLAMMDLGSTVCKPKQPGCNSCPLENRCRARRRRLQEVIPEIHRDRKKVKVHQLAAVLRRGERVFLTRRPDEGLLGGMWELPGCDGGEERGRAVRLARVLSRRWGVPVRAGAVLTTAEHSITYRKITVHAVRATIPPGARLPGGRWVGPLARSRVPVSTATRKILRALDLGTGKKGKGIRP